MAFSGKVKAANSIQECRDSASSIGGPSRKMNYDLNHSESWKYNQKALPTLFELKVKKRTRYAMTGFALYVVLFAPFPVQINIFTPVRKVILAPFHSLRRYLIQYEENKRLSQ